MKLPGKVSLASAMAAAVVAGVALSSALPGAGPCAHADDLEECVRLAGMLGEVYRLAADAVSPAVVHVASSRPGGGIGRGFLGRFFDIPRDTVALGSGVILRPDGYIVTNYHVVKGSGMLTVKLPDGRTFEADVVGTDPPTDLAVIRVAAEGLPAAELGDSDQTAVGHLVLAIGNPYGLDRTVTQGIISATGRANVGIADYEDFIQTDAAINPGNSGGPLIDVRGKVIGINTAIFTRTGGFQGISLAIPSNMAKRVVEALIEQGHVTRGYLGVTIQNMTPELARELGVKPGQGVVVTDVAKNAPAERAGLKEGDVIIEYEGRPVTDVRTLRSMVATTPIGKEVKIAIVRDSAGKILTVEIGEHRVEEISPPPRVSGKVVPRIGISISDLTEEARQRFEIRARKGVLIVGVVPGSPADKAGIKPGLIILELNHKRVDSVGEFEKLIGELPRQKNILLLLQDSRMKYYVVVRPGP